MQRPDHRRADGGVRPDAVINPYDRYRAYLILALKSPATYQLITSLMSPAGTELPDRRGGPADGRWVVCANSCFGHEVAPDLKDGGLEVTVVARRPGSPT